MKKLTKCHADHLKFRANGSMKVTIAVPPDSARAVYGYASENGHDCLAKFCLEQVLKGVRSGLELAKERKDAASKRKLDRDNIAKHQDGDGSGETSETGSGNCVLGGSQGEARSGQV